MQGLMSNGMLSKYWGESQIPVKIMLDLILEGKRYKHETLL